MNQPASEPFSSRFLAHLIFCALAAWPGAVAGQESNGNSGPAAVCKALTKEFSEATGIAGYTFLASEHFILGGALPPAELKALAILAENVGIDFTRRFGGPQEDPKGFPQVLLVFCASKSDCLDSWQFLRRLREPWIPEHHISGVLRWGQASLDQWGLDLVVGASDYPAFVINSAAWFWVHQYAFLPPALACIDPARKRPENLKCFLSDWAALSLCGRNPRPRIFPSPPHPSPLPGLENYRELVARWAAGRICSTGLGARLDLTRLFEAPLNRLDGVARALGIAFIDYCAHARPGALETILRCVRRGWDFSEAFHQAFGGLSEEEFIAAFKVWIVARYTPDR